MTTQSFGPGDIVKVGDRNNYGTIVSVSKDTAMVHFVSREGIAATKPFSLTMIKAAGAKNKQASSSGKRQLRNASVQEVLSRLEKQRREREQTASSEECPTEHSCRLVDDLQSSGEDTNAGEQKTSPTSSSGPPATPKDCDEHQWIDKTMPDGRVAQVCGVCQKFYGYKR